MVDIRMPRPIKVRCPWCGVLQRTPHYRFVEGDLIQCSKCRKKIEVIKNEFGKLMYIKSTDTFGD